MTNLRKIQGKDLIRFLCLFMLFSHQTYTPDRNNYHSQNPRLLTSNLYATNSIPLRDPINKLSVPIFGDKEKNETSFNTLSHIENHRHLHPLQISAGMTSASKEEKYYCGELENDQDSLILETNLLDRYSPMRVNKCKPFILSNSNLLTSIINSKALERKFLCPQCLN